jgi:hypothetical protein
MFIKIRFPYWVFVSGTCSTALALLSDFWTSVLLPPKQPLAPDYPSYRSLLLRLWGWNWETRIIIGVDYSGSRFSIFYAARVTTKYFGNILVVIPNLKTKLKFDWQVCFQFRNRATSDILNVVRGGGFVVLIQILSCVFCYW